MRLRMIAHEATRAISVSARLSCLAIALPVISGCSDSREPARITIELPGKAAALAAGKTGAPGESQWSASVPASLGEIGCYAIFVGGPEAEMNGGFCKDAAGGLMMKFGRTAGLFSAGSTAVIEVPAGSDRRFYVLGFKLVAGRCEFVMPASHELTLANYSSPYLVGQASASIQPGDNSIAITLMDRFTDANKVADCSFMPARNPSPSPSPAPTPTPRFAVAQMALGQGHTCAQLTDGRVKCWGLGMSGALGGASQNLGDGPDEMGDALPFVDLGTGRTAKSIGAGNNFTCAHLDNDTIKCWGANTYGQLGRGNTSSYGLSPEQMGDALSPINIGTARTVKQMAVGESHVCVIRSDDSVVCWGKNGGGQLGISTGTGMVGSMVGQMGDAMTSVELWGAPVRISAGLAHTCALLADGSSRCWGANAYGQLGNGTTAGSFLPVTTMIASGATDVLVGREATCWRLFDMTVHCTGQNNAGVFGNGSVGGSVLTPMSAVVGLGAVHHLSISHQHGCAVNDGSAFCWGSGFLGRTGLNSTTATTVPVGVPLLGRVQKVFTPGATTGGHTCAVFMDGQVKCWGDNTYGQLGYGDVVTQGDGAGEMELLPFVNLGTNHN